MKILILLLALTLAGCENGQFVSSEAARQIEIKLNIQKGKARIALFKDCMELAIEIKRLGDDDVSDIVDSCSSQASYMTNYQKYPE